MNVLLLLGLFMLFLVIAGIWQLIQILRTGIFPGRRRYPDIYRKNSPGQFWVAIAVYGVILLLVTHFTVSFLINAL